MSVRYRVLDTRGAFLAFLFIAVVVLGAGIGLRDPWPSDEPRFALVARQMVESGDWLFPRRGSELYSDKPPMLMWLQAATFELTHNWRVAFLLPSLLASLLTLALTYDLGRRLWSRRVGLCSAVALLATIMFGFQAKRAQIDALVTSLITLANWAFAVHLLRGPHWRLWWLGCFAAGLGVITKGVGVIALLVLVPYLLMRRLGWPDIARPSRSPWRWAGGLAAFVAAIALWLVPMIATALSRSDPEYVAYVKDILFAQTAMRYAGEVGGHRQPFWYFVPVLVVHFFPMSLAYLPAWRQWRVAWASRDARTFLLLGWCALVFLFFSLAGGKREVYLMPMLPMLALALGPTLSRLIDAAWFHRVGLYSAASAAAAFAAVGFVIAVGDWPSVANRLVDHGLDVHARALAMFAMIVGAVFLAWAAVLGVRHGVAALLAGLGSMWLLWGLWGAPLLNDDVSSARIMHRADDVAGPNGELALVAWKEQNMLMSPRRPVDFGFKEPVPVQLAQAVLWQAEAPGRRWIFAPLGAVESCIDPSRATDLGYANRRHWILFSATAVRGNCASLPP